MTSLVLYVYIWMHMRTAFGSRLPDQQPWLQRGGEGKIVWQALHTEKPLPHLQVGRYFVIQEATGYEPNYGSSA